MSSPSRTLFSNTPNTSPYKFRTSKFDDTRDGAGDTNTASFYNTTLKLKGQSIYDLGFQDLHFSSVRHHKSETPLKAVIPTHNQFLVVAKRMQACMEKELQQSQSMNESIMFKSRFSIDPSTQMSVQPPPPDRSRSPPRLTDNGLPYYQLPKQTLIAAKEKERQAAYEVEQEEKRAKIIGQREYDIRDKSGNKLLYNYTGFLVPDSEEIKPVKTGKKHELNVKYWH